MNPHNPDIQPNPPYRIKKAILPIERFTIAELFVIGMVAGSAVSLMLFAIAAKFAN